MPLFRRSSRLSIFCVYDFWFAIKTKRPNFSVPFSCNGYLANEKSNAVCPHLGLGLGGSHEFRSELRKGCRCWPFSLRRRLGTPRIIFPSFKSGKNDPVNSTCGVRNAETSSLPRSCGFSNKHRRYASKGCKKQARVGEYRVTARKKGTRVNMYWRFYLICTGKSTHSIRLLLI